MMIKTKNISYQFQTLSEYQVRREGRYLVVPVVMMVDGVHSGSEGPILHQSEYFGRNAEDWDGVPLTAGHPVDGNGNPISINDADFNLWGVGYVRNARMEDGRLKAEAWIDQQRAIAVNPEIVNYINEGRRLEVSTGAFTAEVQNSGEWHGEQYNAITTEYMPDHLALLPGGRGACSWSDGCGIRNNEQNEEEANEMSEKTKNPFQALKDQIKKGVDVLNSMQANEMGFLEISNNLQSMLDRMDSQARIHFLKEVFDDSFIYEVRDRDQGTQRFFRQNFSVQENGDIEFVEDAQEVRRNVEFLPIQANKKNLNNNRECGCSLKRTKFSTNQSEEANMSNTDKQPTGEVMDKVVALINNERTRFSKADRQWLLQLNEEQLEKLEPSEPLKTDPTREEALQVLADDLADAEKLKTILPNEIREKVEAGMKAYDDHRAKLVKAIQANTPEGTWKSEQLENMDTGVLENIAKSVRKPDYSGNGSPVVNTQAGEGDEEMLLPGGVELKS